MKQTAVEWIEGYLKKFNYIEESLSLKKAFEQAKEMEEEQIMDAFITSRDPHGISVGNSHSIKKAEQYYNETFKSE